jgi:hypothetical protein
MTVSMFDEILSKLVLNEPASRERLRRDPDLPL